MAQKIEIEAVVIVFVKSKHILPKDITYTKDEYHFAHLPMANEEKNVTEKIILSMYNDNIQIRREKDLSTFHKFDWPLLWCFNTVGYHRHLVLAYFVDNFAFRDLAPDIFFCNNCLYGLNESINLGEDFGVPN